jgi:hypothetical protein
LDRIESKIIAFKDNYACDLKIYTDQSIGEEEAKAIKDSMEGKRIGLELYIVDNLSELNLDTYNKEHKPDYGFAW